MKKLILLSLIVLGTYSTTHAQYRVFDSGQVGTSPVTNYYLKTDGKNSFWAAVTGGSGGSGGGTFSTSTAWGSILYNFPNNLTDILSIGYDGSGVATSSDAEFVVDPTAKLGLFLNSTKVGIGTTSPYAPLSVVGQIVGGYFTATTSTASTFPLANITKLSNLTSNGFVKTSGSDGTLSVDTTTYESGLTAGDGLTRTVNDFDCDTASGSTFGCLTSADHTTFSNKQPAGNYITALTGDVTATGPGSVAATLATVNSNVGSYTNANITVNAKGLITAASNGTAGSGGTGNVATSSAETKGQLPYWTSTSGTPATLGSVATTSVSCTGSTSCTPFTVIGSSPISISSSGAGITGGTANMLASWVDATNLTATGTPQAASYIATSTHATSTFAGNIMIGNSLFNGQLDITSLGTGVAQLQVSTSTNDFAKVVYANTSSGASSMFCNIYNNGRSTRLGVSSSYYAGICAAGHNYATPGFDGIKPNGIAIFASDGDVSIGSASTNAASSSIRMFVGSGFSSSAQDAILEGGTARFGLSTSSPWGKLSIATANLTTNRPLFVIASSSAAIATTTHFIVGSNGNVAINTTNTTGQLTIVGTNTDPNQGFYNNRYGGASAPAFITQQARGTEASPSATQTSDGLFFFGSRGYGDSQFSVASVGAIGMAAASTFTNASNPTYIYFSTTPVGSTARAERVRIDPNGYVGIGTTGPTQRLEVEGGVRYNTATSKPTCDSAVRGTTWHVRSGAGVKDTFEICAKDAADTYAWRTIY